MFAIRRFGISQPVEIINYFPWTIDPGAGDQFGQRPQDRGRRSKKSQPRGPGLDSPQRGVPSKGGNGGLFKAISP